MVTRSTYNVSKGKKWPPVVVDPGKEWQKSIRKALKEVGDLRPAFETMADSWYNSNLSIFPVGRKSEGKFEDLSAAYKKQKFDKWGFIYPILRASGLLGKSLTIPGDPNGIKIISKRNMILGTKVVAKPSKKHPTGFPYPVVHQLGGKFHPRRPFMFIGVEQVKEAKAEIYQTRLKLWIKVLETYVSDVIRMRKTRK